MNRTDCILSVISQAQSLAAGSEAPELRPHSPRRNRRDPDGRRNEIVSGSDGECIQRMLRGAVQAATCHPMRLTRQRKPAILAGHAVSAPWHQTKQAKCTEVS
jgi:hypothetical protein